MNPFSLPPQKKKNHPKIPQTQKGRIQPIHITNKIIDSTGQETAAIKIKQEKNSTSINPAS